MSAALSFTLLAMAFASEAPVQAPVEAPKPASREEQAEYAIEIRLYRGSMQTVGEEGSSCLARPSLRSRAGQPGQLFVGGEKRITRRNGRAETITWGLEVSTSVRPAGHGLVRVDATVTNTNLRVGERPESDYEVVPEGSARFVGTIPRGEWLRFAGDNVWAELRVDQL